MPHLSPALGAQGSFSATAGEGGLAAWLCGFALTRGLLLLPGT